MKCYKSMLYPIVFFISLILISCGGSGGGGGKSITPPTLGSLQTPYTVNGADWNRYVKNDGSTPFNASDTACEAGVDGGGYEACIHGGATRFINVGNVSDCTGISAADSLGVFEWSCDDSTTQVVLYSHGFKQGKYLSDLIDFGTQSWRSLSVTGYQQGVAFGSSAESTWWNNTIALANGGGSLSSAGTVYLVTADPLADYTINADHIALLVQPGLSISGSGGGRMVDVFNDYFWFEGALGGSGGELALRLSASEFSVLYGVSVTNAGNGIYLTSGSHNNFVSDVVTSGIGSVNIYLGNASVDNSINQVELDGGSQGIFAVQNSDRTRVRNASIRNTSGDGIRLSGVYDCTLQDVEIINSNLVGLNINNGSGRNRVSHARIANTTTDGVYISGADNILSHLHISNTGANGINLSTASNNVLVHAVLNNSGSHGLSVIGSSSNTILGFTSLNSAQNGLHLFNNSNGNRLSSLLVANSVNRGLSINASSNTSVSDISSVHNNYGVWVETSNDNVFAGLFKVGGNTSNDCVVSGGSNPGLENFTCASAATLSTGVDASASLVGKVSSDASNAQGASGVALFEDIVDWLNFDNDYRGWGIDGAAFPSADQQGRCTTGVNCRIWDASAKATDIGDNNNPVILNTLGQPAGDETFVHTWFDASTTTALMHAEEVANDGIGNDNALCESAETCVYTPNMGAYQGHGKRLPVANFSDGIISGINLLQYDSNGY